jgi:hypothetical protein
VSILTAAWRSMARRRRLPDPDVPARLIEFSPLDWHGDTTADRFRQWQQARHAYFQEHGEPCHALGGPNSQYGDILDMWRRDGEVRLEWWEVLYGVPHYSQQRQ